MHSRVTPSTVAFTLQVPLATAVTVPLELTVATEVLVEDQVGVELVPDTFRVHLSPAKARVKSFRLRGYAKREVRIRLPRVPTTVTRMVRA